jgi:hypothetical protein
LLKDPLYTITGQDTTPAMSYGGATLLHARNQELSRAAYITGLALDHGATDEVNFLKKPSQSRKHFVVYFFHLLDGFPHLFKTGAPLGINSLCFPNFLKKASSLWLPYGPALKGLI